MGNFQQNAIVIENLIYWAEKKDWAEKSKRDNEVEQRKDG